MALFLSAADLSADILAPACIFFVGASFTFAIKFYGLKTQSRTSITAQKKTIKELRAELESLKDTFKTINRYNDEEIERQQQEIERFHNGIDKLDDSIMSFEKILKGSLLEHLFGPKKK